MQLLANGMQALISSLGSTTTRGMGGSLPDKPGVFRVVRFEMRKMRPEGLADSKERARSSPAKAEGGGWAHGAISLSRALLSSACKNPRGPSLSHRASSTPPARRNYLKPFLIDLANTNFRCARYIAHEEWPKCASHDAPERLNLG